MMLARTFSDQYRPVGALAYGVPLAWVTLQALFSLHVLGSHSCSSTCNHLSPLTQSCFSDSSMNIRSQIYTLLGATTLAGMQAVVMSILSRPFNDSGIQGCRPEQASICFKCLS